LAAGEALKVTVMAVPEATWDGCVQRLAVDEHAGACGGGRPGLGGRPARSVQVPPPTAVIEEMAGVAAATLSAQTPMTSRVPAGMIAVVVTTTVAAAVLFCAVP
jgi:hypothetical protein